MNFVRSSLSRVRLERIVPALATAPIILVANNKDKRSGDKRSGAKSSGDRKSGDRRSCSSDRSKKKSSSVGSCHSSSSGKQSPSSCSGTASESSSSSSSSSAPPFCYTVTKPNHKEAKAVPSGTCILSVPKPVCSKKAEEPSCPTDGRDRAAQQLTEFKKSHTTCCPLTTSAGSPIGNKTTVFTAGSTGPLLLQDFVFFDEMAHFNRERIPERVVFAKGAGAYGCFEVTNDVSKFFKASVFGKCGKKTQVAVRFSTMGGETGSADTVRDLRGFAIKFYTDDGNWDLVGQNLPVFFIRDPMMMPSLVHSQRRNPVTHLKDYDAFWDFISLRPETTHMVLMLFSDRGIPDGYRHMHGYSVNTYKMTNKECQSFYCRFFFKSDQGIRNLDIERAAQLAASDPDYATRDLYNAIACKDNPSWTVYFQCMPVDDVDNFPGNPFDPTKVWPHCLYPICQCGRLTLNRLPKNYFSEVEQMAFSPAHMIPGIEPSPDKILQGRLFAYSDSQRYRLGANHLQIPVNCPYKTKVENYQRDGKMWMMGNQVNGNPNYFPNSFNGPIDNCRYNDTCVCLYDAGDRHDNSDDDNYCQAQEFYQKVLCPEEKERLVTNIACHLKHAQPCIQERVIENFLLADVELGEKLKLAMCGPECFKKKAPEEEEPSEVPNNVCYGNN